MESQIVKAMKDCIVDGPVGEFQADLKVEGAVFVETDSLMDFKGWIDIEKAKRIFEDVIAHVKRLPKPFLYSEINPDSSWSFLNLPFLDNGYGKIGQQWGSGLDAGLLVLICSYYGIVQDTLKTAGIKPDQLKDAPGGVSFFSFNVDEGFLSLVRKNLGLS